MRTRGFPAAAYRKFQPFRREGNHLSQELRREGMGRGRAPCCDKSKVKRGPWSPSEDLRLISFIQEFGHDNWRSLPKQAGLLRCGKSCRLRWINYLRPDVKRGNFTKEEEDTIISLHQSIGNKWSRIAAYLPGRTDNEIKNIWNTYLKKRLVSPPIETSSAASASPSPSSSSSSAQFVDKVDEPMSQSIVGMAAVGEQPLPPPCQTQAGSLKLDLSTSSGSSISTQESDFSHNFDQLAKDPDPGDSLFDLLGPKPEDTLEEVDKPNCSVQNNAMEMEVPLEFDYDFWNMFDNLDPLLAHLDGLDIQPTTSDVEACRVNLWGEDIQFNGEIAVENRNWLRRLERELGLEIAGKDSDMGFPSDF